MSVLAYDADPAAQRVTRDLRGHDPAAPNPQPRGPFYYVAETSNVKHADAACPTLQNANVYRAYGAEEALYAFGEVYCERCYWL